MIPDHYKTLGVSRDANLATIKKVHRSLIKKYHDDKPESKNDPEAAKKAKEINWAWNVLKIEKERQEYNKQWDAVYGNSASGVVTDASPTSSVPDLTADVHHIAFGDVKPGSTSNIRFAIHSTGGGLELGVPEIRFYPVVDGLECVADCSGGTGFLRLDVTVLFHCPHDISEGAIKSLLVVCFGGTELKTPVTANIIMDDVSFSTYDDTADTTSGDGASRGSYDCYVSGLADDDPDDDDGAWDDDDDDGTSDYAYSGFTPHTTADGSTTSTASKSTPPVKPPPPPAKDRWFWKFVCSYFAAQLYYVLVALLINAVQPVIFRHPPMWIDVVVGTWLFVSTLLVGAITFFALRGNRTRASGAGQLLLYSTVAVLVLVAATSFIMGIASMVEQQRIANKVLVSEKSDFIIPPNTVIFDDFNNDTAGSDHGVTYGVSQVGRHNFHYAAFTQEASSRIEYPRGIPSEGTLEFWVYVTDGYYWHNSQFFPHEHATMFSTDAHGGDVAWPGASKLMVSSNGDVQFYMTQDLTNNPPSSDMQVKGTGFRFNQWHAIGISYGSEGQAIMVDGTVVGSHPLVIQILGAGGDHQGPRDIPTIGESVSHFWPRHAYDGGFEGFVGLFRASSVQRDWHFARGINESYFTTPPAPTVSAEDQHEQQLVQQAQALFDAHNYDAALADCNEALVLNAGDQTAIQLKNQIQQAMQPTGTGTDTTTSPPGTTTAVISTSPPPLPATNGVQTSITAQAPSAPQTVTIQQWLTLAEGQFERDDLKSALQSCNAALQIDPHNEDANRFKGKIENTMKILGFPAIAQAPSAPQTVTIQQWLTLAESQFERNNFKGALRSCNAALQIDPHNGQAIQLKGKIAATMKVLGDTQ